MELSLTYSPPTGVNTSSDLCTMEKIDIASVELAGGAHPTKILLFDTQMLLPFRQSIAKFSPKLFDVGIAFGSGVIMGVTFAPSKVWYLAWVALAPLWYLGSRQQNPPLIYAASLGRLGVTVGV